MYTKPKSITQKHFKKDAPQRGRQTPVFYRGRWMFAGSYQVQPKSFTTKAERIDIFFTNQVLCRVLGTLLIPEVDFNI